MNNVLYTQDLGKVDGIDLKFNALIEHASVFDIFEELEAQQIAKGINRGDIEWFCAQVVGSINGIELSSVYLGCCAYDSYDYFIDSSELNDMKIEAAEEAQKAVKQLSQQSVSKIIYGMLKEKADSKGLDISEVALSVYQFSGNTYLEFYQVIENWYDGINLECTFSESQIKVDDV